MPAAPSTTKVPNPQPRRHEVEMLQESFLRVTEPDDPSDFRDVSTIWEAPACGIRILYFVHLLVDALCCRNHAGI